MDSLLKSDIFFFITSVVVIILGIIGAIILYYGVKIFRHVEHIGQKLSEQSDNVSKDIEELRAKFREGGMKVGNLLGMFMGFAARNFGGGMMSAFKKKTGANPKKRKSRKSTVENDEDSEE